MLTDVELSTADVVIPNVALLLPAGTVTLAGTPVAVELSLKVTATPPLGAGPLSVTVPCAEEAAHDARRAYGQRTQYRHRCYRERGCPGYSAISSRNADRCGDSYR